MATVTIDVRNENGTQIGRQESAQCCAAHTMAALANQGPAMRVFHVEGTKLGIITAVMELYDTGCIGLRHLHGGEFRTHSLTEMQAEIDGWDVVDTSHD